MIAADPNCSNPRGPADKPDFQPDYFRAVGLSSARKLRGLRDVGCDKAAFSGDKQFMSVQQPADAIQQPIHRERLADVVIDPEHLGVRLVPAALVGGHHDDPQRCLLAAAKPL